MIGLSTQINTGVYLKSCFARLATAGWAIGFAMETFADYQKSEFKAQPGNKDKCAALWWRLCCLLKSAIVDAKGHHVNFLFPNVTS